MLLLIDTINNWMMRRSNLYMESRDALLWASELIGRKNIIRFEQSSRWIRTHVFTSFGRLIWLTNSSCFFDRQSFPSSFHPAVTKSREEQPRQKKCVCGNAGINTLCMYCTSHTYDVISLALPNLFSRCSDERTKFGTISMFDDENDRWWWMSEMMWVSQNYRCQRTPIKSNSSVSPDYETHYYSLVI